MNQTKLRHEKYGGTSSQAAKTRAFHLACASLAVLKSLASFSCCLRPFLGQATTTNACHKSAKPSALKSFNFCLHHIMTMVLKTCFGSGAFWKKAFSVGAVTPTTSVDAQFWVCRRCRLGWQWSRPMFKKMSMCRDASWCVWNCLYVYMYKCSSDMCMYIYIYLHTLVLYIYIYIIYVYIYIYVCV